MEYLINVLLTNGDIFSRKYETMKLATDAFNKLIGNPLVVHASLHDANDNEMLVIDNTTTV
jgi:hypothetical protein